MLVSEYGLDVQPYNETPVNDIRWEDCTLRQWLNEDFYESAFSSEEKEKILLSASAGFPKFNSRVVGGEYQYLERETEDKVFLLSYTEVRRYFPDPDGRGNGSNDYRRCYPTEYAKKSPALKTYQGTCGWWLCTGFYGYADRCRTMAASELGSLNAEEKCESMEYAVRPAIWITWQIQEAENETALMSNENVVSGYDRYHEKWTGRRQGFSGYNFNHFCGNFFTETGIMLHENHSRTVFQKQFFNLHPGKYIDIIQRFIPDI